MRHRQMADADERQAQRQSARRRRRARTPRRCRRATARRRTAAGTPAAARRLTTKPPAASTNDPREGVALDAVQMNDERPPARAATSASQLARQMRSTSSEPRPSAARGAQSRLTGPSPRAMMLRWISEVPEYSVLPTESRRSRSTCMLGHVAVAAEHLHGVEARLDEALRDVELGDRPPRWSRRCLASFSAPMR